MILALRTCFLLRKRVMVFMETNGLIWKFYHFSEIVMKIAIFQIIWIALTLMGGIILGLMPATVGLFTVIRKWRMGNEQLRSLVEIYWITFRKEFWKANTIGFVLFSIGFLIYLNFSIIRFTNGLMHLLLFIFIITLSILFLILLLYVIPVFVHFEFKLQQYLTMSLLLGISFPFHTILLAFGYYILFRLFLWVPGLIPFFSVSVVAFFTMWVSMNIFHTMENKVRETSNFKLPGLNPFFHKKTLPSENQTKEV
ncbi:hypothetical protein COK19_07295 [Bacillus cereus]|nr:hypothetical protein COK19_07295 [Bacillus cereus]